MRVNSKYSKTISTMRLFTPCLMIPIMIGVNLTRYKVTPLIATLTIVIYTNKAFAEPHIVTVASVLQFIFFRYEIPLGNDALGMLYSIFIARKVTSILYTVHYSATSRLPYICNKYEN